MLSSSTILIAISLLSAGISQSAPVPYRRAVETLDEEATAEAHVRDETATRAFTAVPIKTTDGQCLSVNPLGGDFRANLIPIEAKACDGSPNQEWDVITAGLHNDRAGSALFVSSLTNGCMNFDPRRAAGNQVLLFSCGGRAAGEGRVSDSQLFDFADSTQASVALRQDNGRDDPVCFTITSGLLDRAVCVEGAGSQLFTIGDGATPPPQVPEPAPPVNDTPAPPSPPSPPAAVPTSTRPSILNPEAVAEAQKRDETATRAVTASEIKTADGQCLSVDPEAGDFRSNLIPIEAKACDGSANQQWDLITSGKHNNIRDGDATLVVSTLINGCMNFDPRRAPGNQVLLFSCGGRAAGEGETTDSQLFDFDEVSTTGILAPLNGRGDVCFEVKNGRLDQGACGAGAGQVFAIGDEVDVPTPAPEPVPAPEVPAPAPEVPAAQAPEPQAPTPQVPAPAPNTPSKLNAAATDEAHRRDETATRALSSVQIKTSAGQCLSVDPESGDFRANLLPITAVACDANAAGQKFDVITKGRNNDVEGAALVVSSLMQGCFNFDPRRRAGDQVNIFSCGGRADGSGRVTNSQLFTFAAGSSGPIVLQPRNAQGTCFVVRDGRLDQAACDGSNAQLFTLA